MKEFGMVLLTIGFMLGCRSSVRGYNVSNIDVPEPKKTLLQPKPKLVPLIQNQSSISSAYDDLRSLLAYFRKQLEDEYKHDPITISLFMDSVKFSLNSKLLVYNSLKSDRTHNVYIALGHDLEIIKDLVSILSTLNLTANDENIDVRIASLLLFNLEQIAYLIFLLNFSLSNENLRKIKNSKIVTVDDINQITGFLFLFMRKRDDLIRDVGTVLKEASVVRDDRRAMEMYLKKIVQDGEIKRKISAMRELIQSIDNLISSVI
ncbi:hypothetical protein CNO14_04340 (plasmid) [Borrelia miyamotoi]|uniref:Lipoprotein n=1 Tax=Borrelia miyamotoi TaxID=47466 RepID=A0AAP9CGF2_9SPIR|nr:hypothetical protein [Borrelia miyamotoi]AHH05440.1 Hypothetical protein BOM_0897 [Borrelia miyamotoi FR64b]ATQ15236.1 hypothetical protein CNO14_04340 [Borrelia miyamotoi]ATQ16452.1 hypothetical protein CNO13_04525 [Borrelia miyamotoi]ATQ17565.1 hypothetical protein CNO12_04345 [Borrelia miyamotoi]ATQ18809.1 hypothetical protein CNO11_04335 [Borrelia miyamotoi]